VAALSIQAVAGLVLLFAGAQKLAQPADVERTIRALDLPGSPRALAAGLGVTEISTAAALVLAPQSLLTAALVVALGAGFATAGMVAMARSMRVHCACLGPALSGPLGLRQVCSLPLWVLAGGAGVVDRSIALAGHRLEVLVVLALVVTLGALVRAAPLAREHRTQLYVLMGR
jgi:hypothetical protein